MEKSQYKLISDTHARGLRRQEARSFMDRLNLEEPLLLKTNKRQAIYRHLRDNILTSYKHLIIDKREYDPRTNKAQIEIFAYAPQVREIILFVIRAKPPYRSFYEVLKLSEHAVERMIQRTKVEEHAKVVREIFDIDTILRIQQEVIKNGDTKNAIKIDLKIGAGMFLHRVGGFYNHEFKVPLMTTYLRRKQ